jgi:hypothetical protein
MSCARSNASPNTSCRRLVSPLHSILFLAMRFAPVYDAGIAACRNIRDNNAVPEVLTIRIDHKTKLEKLAKAMDHTKSGLAA